MKTIAIIIAAGRSKRMQDHYSVPKQYLPLGKSTVLRETILKFKNHPDISDVICVIHEDDLLLYKESIFDLDILNPVLGGEYRHESIYKGLQALEEFSPTNVIIHDANRPFVDKEITDGIISSLEYCDAVVPAIKEDEMVKISKSGNIIERTIDQKTIWRIQTPGGYKYENLVSLYEEDGGESSQDIPSMFENAGLPVSIIPGSKKNFKILDKDDYKRAQDIYALKEQKFGEIRVGNSFDCYKFENDKKAKSNLKICGVEVPIKKITNIKDPKNLGFNTIGDALMGAIGVGCAYCCHKKENIGKSKKNLKFISKLLNKKSTVINNIDITIVCNSLDICQYRKVMIKEISSRLNIPTTRVNIKDSSVDMMMLDSFKDSDKLMISVSVCVKVI